MIPFLVLLSVLICDVNAGVIGDDCDSLEIRAPSCEAAAVWAGAWVPSGKAIVLSRCVEQRMAAR